MLITQKHKYALRAIYELGKQFQNGQVKLAAIAEAQAIPLRFLEVIMAELKPSGLVASKRGYYGGYTLLLHPREITVGDLFRFLRQHDGDVPVDPVAHLDLLTTGLDVNVAGPGFGGL